MNINSRLSILISKFLKKKVISHDKNGCVSYKTFQVEMEDADYELKSEMQEAKVIRRELT